MAANTSTTRALSAGETVDPALEAAPRPVPPSVLLLLALIWVRPRRSLALVADGPGWLWVAPFGLLALTLYLRFLVLTAITRSYEALFALLTGLAAVILGWLLRSAILWLGSAALGSRVAYARLYRLAAWAAFPLILREIVHLAYLLLTRSLPANDGLAGLLAGGSTLGNTLETAVWSAVLSRIDLYTVWFFVLLFFALRAGTALSRWRSLCAVLFYGLLALVLLLASALINNGLIG